MLSRIIEAFTNLNDPAIMPTVEDRVIFILSLACGLYLITRIGPALLRKKGSNIQLK